MTVILFDGVCNLCNGLVRFVIERDPEARFAFASLQSEAAARLLAHTPLGSERVETIVLIERGRMFTRSTAALRIARGLGFPWNLAGGLIAIPRPLRDWIYDLVARHRYHWFGRQDVCMTPTADIAGRFLR